MLPKMKMWVSALAYIADVNLQKNMFSANIFCLVTYPSPEKLKKQSIFIKLCIQQKQTSPPLQSKKTTYPSKNPRLSNQKTFRFIGKKTTYFSATTFKNPSLPKSYKYPVRKCLGPPKRPCQDVFGGPNTHKVLGRLGKTQPRKIPTSP